MPASVVGGVFPAVQLLMERAAASGYRAELSDAEIRRLFRAWQHDRDERARERLVLRFMPLARRLARRYTGANEPLDELDTTWLVGTIFRHRDETSSEVAARILSDWQYSVRQFVKVMPRDYKRVLAAIAAAEEQGENIDEAIMAAAKG